MNTLEIKGDWNMAKGKLKQKWAKLTDDDLQFRRRLNTTNCWAGCRSAPAKPVKRSRKRSRNPPPAAANDATFGGCEGGNHEKTKHEKSRFTNLSSSPAPRPRPSMAMPWPMPSSGRTKRIKHPVRVPSARNARQHRTWPCASLAGDDQSRLRRERLNILGVRLGT